jgi:hypothetical protein
VSNKLGGGGGCPEIQHVIERGEEVTNTPSVLGVTTIPPPLPLVRNLLIRTDDIGLGNNKVA